MLVPLAEHEAERRRLRLVAVARHRRIADEGRPQVGDVAVPVRSSGGTSQASGRLRRRERQVLAAVERVASGQKVKPLGGGLGHGVRIDVRRGPQGRAKGRLVDGPGDARTPMRSRLVKGAKHSQQRHEGEEIVRLQPVETVGRERSHEADSSSEARWSARRRIASRWAKPQMP